MLQTKNKMLQGEYYMLLFDCGHSKHNTTFAQFVINLNLTKI